MDLQALHALVEVADSGSFSRAAERLHRSQPAVSKRIAALERQLGSALFDRVGRLVQPTAAGIALLPYARRVLQELEDGRRALSRLPDRVAGKLSIGTSHHIGLHRLPRVLKRYTQKFPDVNLDLHFMDSEVACEAVLAGRLELGIVTLPTQSIGNLDSRKIWDDPLAVVAAPMHPLAKQGRVRLADLAVHPAVLPDAATYTHRIIKSELQKHGLEPRVRLATNYLETLKMLVAIGLGWSVLPRSMLDRSIIELTLPALTLQRELGAVWHHRRNLSAAAQALLSELGR